MSVLWPPHKFLKASGKVGMGWGWGTVVYAGSPRISQE